MGLSRLELLRASHQIERRLKFLEEDSGRFLAASGVVRRIAEFFSHSETERTDFDRLLADARARLRRVEAGLREEELWGASREIQIVDQRIRLAETVWRRYVGEGMAGAKRGLGSSVLAGTVVSMGVGGAVFLAGSAAIHGGLLLYVMDAGPEMFASSPTRVKVVLPPRASSRDSAAIKERPIEQLFEEISEPAGPIAPPSRFAELPSAPDIRVDDLIGTTAVREALPVKDEQEVIAEAQAFLAKWKADHNDPSLASFDLGRFLIEAAAAAEKWRAAKLASMTRRWERRVESYQRAGDSLLEIVFQAFTHDLVHYTAALATLEDLFRGEGGNCEAQTLLLTAALHAARVAPPTDGFFAVQGYRDHLQIVVYRPSEGDKVWNPLSGERDSLLKAPLFHPIPYILDAYLAGRGAESPVARRDLLIAEADCVETKRYPTPPTNSSLRFRYREGYFAQRTIPESDLLVWPYGREGRGQDAPRVGEDGLRGQGEDEGERQWIVQWNSLCAAARKEAYAVSEIASAESYQRETERERFEARMGLLGYAVADSSLGPCDLEQIWLRWGGLDRFWRLPYETREFVNWYARKRYLVFEDRGLLERYRSSPFEKRIDLLVEVANRSLAEEADTQEMADLLTLLADPKVALEIPAERLARMIGVIERSDTKMKTLIDGCRWTARPSEEFSADHRDKEQRGVDAAYRAVYQAHLRLRQLEERAASFRERLRRNPLAFLTLVGRLSPAQRGPFLGIMLRMTMEIENWVESPFYPVRPMRQRSEVNESEPYHIQRSPALQQLANLVTDPQVVLVRERTGETRSLPEKAPPRPIRPEQPERTGEGSRIFEVEMIEIPAEPAREREGAGVRRPYEMDAIHHLQWATLLRAYYHRRWTRNDTTQLLRQNRGGRFDEIILEAINTFEAVSLWASNSESPEWPNFCGRNWNAAFLPVVRDLIRRGKISCAFLKENRYR